MWYLAKTGAAQNALPHAIQASHDCGLWCSTRANAKAQGHVRATHEALHSQAGTLTQQYNPMAIHMWKAMSSCMHMCSGVQLICGFGVLQAYSYMVPSKALG